MSTQGSRRGSGVRVAVPPQLAALIPRETTQALRLLRIGAEKFLLCNQQLRQARSESPVDGPAAHEVAGLIQDVCAPLWKSPNSDLAAAVAMDMIQDDVIRTAVLQIYAVASRDNQTRQAHRANQQQARDTADSGDNGEPVDSLAPSTNDLIHSSLYLLMAAVLPLWQTASFRNPPPSPSRWPPTVISGFMRLLLRMQSFKPISQRLAAGVADARELLRELATGEAELGAGGTVKGAAAVAAVVAPAAVAAAPTAAPEPAAPLRRANAEELVRLLVSELTKSSRFVTTFVCFLDALLHDECDPRQHQSPRGGSSGGGGGGGMRVSYIADLAGALADSHILEHNARAAVTALELVGATAAAGETGDAAGGAAGKAAGGGAAAETLQHDTVEGAIRECIGLLRGLQKVYHLLTYTDRAGSVAGPAPFLPLLRQALSGPCLQYLVLAAAVAVLCAADGGPSYGMQPGLLRRLQCLATAADGEAGREQQQQLSPGVHLLPERALGSLDFTFTAAFHGDLFDDVLFGSQTSRRVVLELALRVGRLAVASARFWGGQQVEEEQQRFVMRKDKVWTFATGALASATKVLEVDCGSAAAGAGAARRWQEAAVDRWRLAADIVEHVDWRQDPKHVIMLAEHLRPQELAEAHGGEREGEGPVTLEPLPPDVAAALAGGLLPCLERLLRRAGRDPSGSGTEVHLLKVLMQDQEFPLVQLLTHADPRQAVAFVVSLHKLLLRQSFVENFLEEGRDGGSGGASSSSGLPKGQAFAFTPVFSCGLLGECSCELRAIAKWSLDLTSGGTGDSDVGGTTATLRRLGLVVTAVLPVGLPAVSATLANMIQQPISGGAAGARIASDARDLLIVALKWIHILAPRGPAAASGGGDGSSEVLTAGDDGSSARAAAGDEGWQSSVLRESNPLELLGAALRVEKRLRLIHLSDGVEVFVEPALLQLLAKCLCLLAEVLPSEVREAARRGAVVEASAMEAAARGAGSSSASGDGGSNPGGRRRARSRRRGADVATSAAPVAAADIVPATDPALPLSYWPPELVRSLAGDLRASGLDDRTAVELEALAGRLVRWGAGEQGSEGNGTVAATTRLSPVEVAVLHALASPAEVEAVLRTCANPACLNLEGDSEAGLRLAACGRCGAAWYCCRDCQTAHWRMGHRAVCRGGAVAAAGARTRAATGLADGD